MKVLCPQCERLLSLEVFRVEGGALIITCSKCATESRVEAASSEVASVPTLSAPARRPPSYPPRVSLASTEGGSNVVVLRTAGSEGRQRAERAAEEGPFAVPDGVCPKCVAQRGESAACPHCGILFASFDAATVLPPDWLSQEWVALLRDWGNEARHVQMRNKAQQADALAEVGRLYRLRQASVPEDPVASTGRAEVLRLASAAISFRPAEEDAQERRKKLIFGATLTVTMVLIVMAVLAQVFRGS